jgi:hypothetical protein
MGKVLRLFYIGILLMNIPSLLLAQDDDYEHLLKGKKIRFSAFAGPIFELSSVHKNFGFSSGGGGALLLNQTLFIGGYGLSLAPVIGKDVSIEGINYTYAEIGFGHGGIWLGYIHDFKKLIHIGGSTKFGWGKISLQENRLPDDYKDNVLVITPQVEVEVNVSKWFKVNVGGGYRIVTSVNDTVFRQKEFNSPQATVGFLFGWFRQKEN